ncbi:glutathione S-transferase family protein [Pelagibius sp. CAU 1746]|uniref:glutathione S-transferase family protein n=1 Tax=Pelagibius sp. CAU 1746 TaxID=3140370 RepID=UPI00325B1933
MYRLYWAPNTGAFAPDAVLTLAGAPFERQRVDYDGKEHQGEAYRKLNPLGQIPLLRLPDGETITESAAMVLHLVERFPEARLAPAPGGSARAVFDRWLVFLAVNVYGAILRRYYAGRFTTDPAGAEGVRQAAGRDLESLFAILEAALEADAFLLGETFGAADIYLMMLVDWYPPAGELPRIGGLCAALKEEPRIAEVRRLYELN